MKRKLNKYLSSLTEKELIQQIKILYDKFDIVKKYYDLELSEDSQEILEEFKSKIRKEYFPSRGFGSGRSGASRKVISEFKKISIHKKDVVELLLYRTEMMLEYTKEYGDIDEAFYNSLESSFIEACKLIKKESLNTQFRSYCQELISSSSSFGWGVYDSLKYAYKEYVE